eukprot:gene8948-8096_t
MGAQAAVYMFLGFWLSLGIAGFFNLLLHVAGVDPWSKVATNERFICEKTRLGWMTREPAAALSSWCYLA